jgi:hypothetical protein
MDTGEGVGFVSDQTVAFIADDSCHSGARSCASHDAQSRIMESITTAGSMDSGPAPLVGYRQSKRIPE